MTHFNLPTQLFNWAYPSDGGKYPDSSIVIPGTLQWYTASFNNTALPAGNNNWQYFEGIKYKITDPNCKIGLPALVATNVNGKVYYDDIEIKEYDANGNFTQNVFSLPLLPSMNGRFGVEIIAAMVEPPISQVPVTITVFI
jgi:hypothetical protein